MPPTRPQASRNSSRTSSRLDLADEQQYQQAGRSSSNLNAAASAQSLRQASRSSSQEPNRPNLLRKKSRPQSALTNIGDESNADQKPIAAAAAPVTVPQSRYSTAAQPAPIDTTSGGPAHLVDTRTSDSSTSSSANPGVGQSAPVSASNDAEADVPPGTAISNPETDFLLHYRPMTGRSDLHQASSASLNRLSTPRSVRDLGADYTRYPNPFATRNNSTQDLTSADASTHLMAPTAVSSTDLSNRLSNPFQDSKRLSNPFDSNPNTSPPTPIGRQRSRENKPADSRAVPLTVAAAAAATAAATITRQGTPAFIREADPEKTPFYPYVDDRLGAPEYAFPLFNDTKEDDDDLHMPQWDDDIKLKPKLRDHFTRENIVSTLGMLLMMAGLLCIFVILPVISYTGTSLIPYGYDTPLSEMNTIFKPLDPSSWLYVNSRSYPLLQNMRHTLIDPDTPQDAMTRWDINGNQMRLVFSDEFNAPNRTFYPGDDPYWYAFDGWYGATQDLEWYDPDAANTGGGTLKLQLDKFKNHGLDYRSAMLNSWNQVCFKGGVFEVSVSLPGPGGVHGLWPGMWTMGNLGRPGYLSTTDGMWPYTYNDCDAGITPNQSMTDGTSNLPGQRLPSCTCSGEDHPSPGTGRGAPEIDIAEVSGDWGGQGLGVATQSFQVAPFDIWYYPNYDYMETPYYNLSMVNTYTGGPFQQAVSTTSMLNNKWYDGMQYQKFAFEYWPGGGKGSYIQWYIGDQEMMKFDARAIGPNGNVGQRLVSEEPMAMVLNLGFSHSWVNIDWSQLKFPTVLQIDYVRWYQVAGQEMVTCDPPGYETTDYIKNHPRAYNNPNYTHWEDAGYSWPKNSLMNDCYAPS